MPEQEPLMQTDLRLENWGLLDYQQALLRQEQLANRLLAGGGSDTLVLVEHPATVTLGRRGTAADLRLPQTGLTARGVDLQNINRGGLATAHEPGQLVAYPILRLKKKDLRWFANTFLQVVVDLLAEYGLQGWLKTGEPGVWIDGRKVCSFGIALKKWVCTHGIALNVNNDLATFDMIVPCGRPEEIVTSLSRELGRPLDLAEVQERFVVRFAEAFGYRLVTGAHLLVNPSEHRSRHEIP